MGKTRILIVDDEIGMLEVCAAKLGCLPETEICVEQRSERAAEHLARQRWDLLITDMCMPGLNGIELLRHGRQHNPNLAVLIITVHPTVETAVECMKLGAADYITKPFQLSQLLEMVTELLVNQQMRQENQLLLRQVEESQSLRTSSNPPVNLGGILGKSETMQQVFTQIRYFAKTNLDVLIEGETGTGKELVARALHEQSSRHARRFVPIDCGAIPEELMESEFFGHERGAFTGALTTKIGLMEHAHQGTLFLDELGQLSPRLQAKLLRVLQERKIRRVGSTREIEVDVRIITASSIPLEKEIRAGRFRMDLYQRIHVAHIHLPPLRERMEDIPLLAHHFLNLWACDIGKEQVKVSTEAMAALVSHSWPGNVRELQNILKRTLALLRGPLITLEHLPDTIVAQADDVPLPEGTGYFAARERRLLAFEKQYLITILSTNRGDVSSASREAQLPRGTFYRLLRKHVLSPNNFRSES